MNELLKQTMLCREKAEALRANKKWAEAAIAYEALAKAWIAAAGVATSASARAERLAESDKALEMASKCSAKSKKSSSDGGKGGRGGRPSKISSCGDGDDLSLDEDEDSEEPTLESLAEILSAFSAVRPNY